MMSKTKDEIGASSLLLDGDSAEFIRFCSLRTYWPAALPLFLHMAKQPSGMMNLGARRRPAFGLDSHTGQVSS